MIRAAALYAEGKGSPPPELVFYLKWKSWHVLPEMGGSRDQRAGELERMLACANAYEFLTERKRGTLKIDKMTSDQKTYLKYLKELLNGD